MIEIGRWRDSYAFHAGGAPDGSGIFGQRRVQRGRRSILAGELGPSGIRVICLRPHAIPEAVAKSHTRELSSGHATRAGSTVEDWLAGLARTATLLKRLPTLAEVANFVASYIKSASDSLLFA